MTSSWKVMAWAIDHVISENRPKTTLILLVDTGGFAGNGQQNTTEHEQKTKQKQKKTSPKPRSFFTM